MIDFMEIPSTWLDPAIFAEVKPNYSKKGVLAYPEKNIIVSQKLAGGTLTAGRIVEVTRADEGYAHFGEGSIGADQVVAFRKANKSTPLYVMAMDDAAGATAATGTITFAGAASVSSTLYFKIGGRRISITALAADTPTALATKLVTAITADNRCAVTATSAVGVVTLTAKNKGACGNEIDVRVDRKVADLPSGLTATIVAMANGATNPNIQTALDAIDVSWFTKICVPWNDTANLQLLDTWLKARYVATSKLDCHGFVYKSGTYGQRTTFGDLTNCAFLTCGGLYRSPTSPWVHAATAMAIASFFLTQDPARQLKSLVLPGVEAPDLADQDTQDERNFLLQHGMCSDICMDDGSVVINRMITTYKKTTLNVADDAWMDIMIAATNSRIRYDWSGYVNLTYPRAKLVDDDRAVSVRRAEGDTAAGAAVVSPRIMKGAWAARCQLYERNVWIENVPETLAMSFFERASDVRYRMNSKQVYQIVGNLMVQAASLEFLA